MNDLDVNTAKYNDLLAYAKGTLGLDVPHGVTKPALLQLIAQQTGQKVAAGMGGESAGMVEAGRQVEKNLKELRKQKKVRIRIHENKDHPKRIPVCVNGVMYTMKPGAWVDVPESVVDVLRNAVITSYSQHEDGSGKIITVGHESLQFPFEIAPQSIAA